MTQLDTPDVTVVQQEDLHDRLRAACARVAPLWPLDQFVAVNPYLGLADRSFAEAAEFLASTAGARATLPAAWYLAQVDAGRITDEDLAGALGAADAPLAGTDPARFVERVRAEAAQRGAEEGATAARVPTVADVAAGATSKDWNHLVVDRVSSWAAAYFDGGQAMWRSSDPTAGPFASWRDEAVIDRTPEVMGLKGFRKVVRSVPADAVAAVEYALDELGIPDEGLDPYVHRLLLRVGGWSAHAARIVWDANLYEGRQDDTLVELLAVQLTWELGLLRCLGDSVAGPWHEAADQLRALGARPEVREALVDRLVLQDAFDRSFRRELVAGFESVAAAATPSAPARPSAQTVFCIDVRSEVFRRHLEAAAADVATIGFAGFFGFAVEYLPLAHDRGETQCPVLLTPAFSVAESVGDAERQAEAVEDRRLRHHVRRAWKSFKMGAVSCFSFVGPVGLVYLPKMFTDAYGRTRPVARPEDEALPQWAVDAKGPSLDPTAAPDGGDPVAGIPLESRVQLATGALTAMSLTSGFAPLVAVVGHGASTTNNPYDTGLDCGACGGHTGEANARVAAAILNDPQVRAALPGNGIEIPADTWFVAAQHNTTTDEITVFDRGAIPASHLDALASLEASFEVAGRGARAERARRMGIDPAGDVDAAVLRRSGDWAQVRPEWGLAGCRAFVVAPRERTKDLDLGGRAFLHSYEWRKDEGFGVLELVMTAPMVVASWISLQYYASTVENRLFGSGNKVLHNVVGKLGVLEGNGGDLRVGLPWQSVHDGEEYQHEPLRLNVVIEAPIDAMNDVLAAHAGVKDLVDNGWLQLMAMDDSGRISHRYSGDLNWEPVAG